MIKPIVCPACGGPKLTRQSILCHKCANQQNTGHSWTDAEVTALKQYYECKNRILALQTEIKYLREEQQATAPIIHKRHSRVGIYYKAKYLRLNDVETE